MVYSALRGPSLFPRFPCRAAFGVVCGVPDSGRVESRWKPVLKRAKKEAVNKDTDSVTGKELFWCIDWFLQKVMRNERLWSETYPADTISGNNDRQWPDY